MKKQKLPPGLYQSHGAWHYRYYERLLSADKTVQQVRRSQKLADVERCAKVADVLPLYHAAAATVSKRAARPSSSMTVGEFWRTNYWPWVKVAKKPSTQRGYRWTWGLLEGAVADIPLCRFTKRDAIAALEPLAYEKQLAHSCVHNARVVLGSLFRRACELDLVEHNPVRDFQTPKGKPKVKGPAYTSEESENIIRVLSGRAKVIAALFSYTGIRPEELCGLQWEDYDGDFLHIRRAVWNGLVVPTKTEQSAATIPVIRPLRQILDDWRPKTAGIGWLVCGDTGNPIRLNNVARREVVPLLLKNKLQWKTWYGFRRGAGTTMSDDLNLSEDQVRAILRHAPGSDTAREHYIVRELKKRQAVMSRFEAHVQEVRDSLDKKFQEAESPYPVV